MSSYVDDFFMQLDAQMRNLDVEFKITPSQNNIPKMAVLTFDDNDELSVFEMVVSPPENSGVKEAQDYYVVKIVGTFMWDVSSTGDIEKTCMYLSQATAVGTFAYFGTTGNVCLIHNILINKTWPEDIIMDSVIGSVFIMQETIKNFDGTISDIAAGKVKFEQLFS